MSRTKPRWCSFVLMLARLFTGGAGAPALASPLSLQGAVARALERSPAVSASRKGVEQAEAREQQALSGLLPRLHFEESYLRTDQPVAGFGSRLNQGRFTAQDFAPNRLNDPGMNENFLTKFTVRQPLFAGGSLYNRHRAGKQERMASEWDLEATRAQIAFRAIEAYWGLSLARESEKVARLAVRTAEESLRQVELLYREGTIVRSDLLSAQVRRADSEDAHVRARGRVEVAERGVSVLIGPSDDGHWEVATLCPPGPAELPERDREELLRAAKEKRPAYVALRARWEAARAGVKAAQGSYLPSLGVEASYEWNAPQFARGQKGSYILGVGVNWDLFTGLERPARSKEARSQREMLWYRLKAMEDELVLEIEEALVSIRTGQESLEVTRERVGQTEESLRIIRKRYGEGLATIVELQQAELTLSRSRLERLGVIHALRLALASLNLSTGELLTSVPALSCVPPEGSG